MNVMAQKKKAPVTVKPAAAKAAAKTVARASGASKPSHVAVKATKPAVKTKIAEPAKAVAAKAKVVAKDVKKPVAPAAKVVSKIESKIEIPMPRKPAISPAASAAAKANAAASVPQRAVPAAAHKPGGQKVTAPVAQTSPASPKAIAEKAAAARQLLAVQKKPVNQRHGFKANEFIVYPAHGVGRIVGIEEQEIAGMSLELFVITFEKEKLTLRVPTGKLASVGMRKLADDTLVKKAMDTLKGRARIKRTMWSRRAQEYVAKINSGDLISIAEVVRDLYRSEAQPEQSYSERQLYEDALDRMARELAAVEKLDERGAVQRITDILSKSAKGRRAAEAEAEDDSSVGEAA